ncbi:MAG: hypothetical protein ACI9YU_000746, partial [Flavobacteriales bacterium]
KKLLFATAIAGTALLIACGPSAEDQAKAQAKQDSIDSAKQAAYDDSVSAAAEKAAAKAAAAAYSAGQSAAAAEEATTAVTATSPRAGAVTKGDEVEKKDAKAARPGATKK